MIAPCFDDVKAGDHLPELTVPLTATLIVAGAIASRDYEGVHHDADAARHSGLPNVFMNILTTNGIVGRFVTDWAGPDAIVRRIAIRLGAPNMPGDTMRMTGTVTATRVAGDKGVVELDVRGSNGLGDHVNGTVELTLPRRGTR